MSGDVLRFGVIGAGMMGQEHLRNLAAMPGAEAVVVADPHQPSRDAAAELAPDAALVADPAELLARDDLHAVVVATPNHTHRAVLDGVWGTDLAVLVEKPLCTTVADCLAVRDAAARHPAPVWMGLEYRFMPPVAELLRRVEAGAAGRVRMVAIREHRFPFLAKVGDWNRFTRNTGGTLVEKCCHFFDLMDLVVGERPLRVTASGAQDVNHLDETYDGEIPDILDNAFVIVDYPRGARGLLDLCMFAEGSRWEQEIAVTGDRGKVEAHLPNFMELARGRRPEVVEGDRGPGWPVAEVAVPDDDRIAHVGAHHGASYLELLHLCEVLRHGGSPQVRIDDGLWSVAVGTAAHRSIEEGGRPVALSELGL